MRIVITGGAGFLGSHTVALFREAGHEVVSVDSNPCAIPGLISKRVDLLDRNAVLAVLARADALVHLGNHNNARRADAPTVLADNTRMNANAFYAAVEHHVPRIVFASSLQAISGGPLLPDHRYARPPERRLPALPVDGDSPAHAGNPYGMSKIFGEGLLAHLAASHDLQAVALRFPWLAKSFRPIERTKDQITNHHRQSELYTWLSVIDAARLILACITSDLPGFRIYQPTAPLPADWPDAETLAREYLPDAPRRYPEKKLDCLVDISRITRETGWTPTPIS